MQIKEQKIDKLIPYVNNARTHSDEKVAQIAASIREFGFCNPVLVDKENNVIAGHGRLLAARKLEMDAVPTIRLEHLTEAQRKAYVLADNKLALNAGWDDELLKIELGELMDMDFEVDLLGFSDEEMKKLFKDVDEKIKDESFESQFSIIIDCSDESEQEMVYDQLTQEGYQCRVVSL